MPVALVKVTNTTVNITANMDIPIIKAVVDVTQPITTEDVNTLYGEIFAKAYSMTAVCATRTRLEHPDISNIPNITYGGTTGFKFVINKGTSPKGLYNARLYFNNILVSNPYGYSGYADYEACFIVIFVDRNNNIHRMNDFMGSGLYVLSDIDPGYRVVNDRYVVADVLTQMAATLRPWESAGAAGLGQIIGDISPYIVDETEPDVPDPYNPGGDTGDDDTEGEGGEGDFDDDEDPIPIPDLPDETDVSAAASRFITLFSPTTAQMNNLADYMWGNGFDLDTFKKLFANPMDCILGLSIVPFNPVTNGTGNVTVGNIETGVSMTKCKQYKSVDCGTINVKKYWGAYLDYAPFTKAEIYLPFIGMRPLSIDDIMGKSVHVVYHIDVLSGACVAFVKCANSVLYNFVGQCSQSIPVTSNDFTNVVNGALGIAGAIGSMVATGGASAPYAVGAIANSAINALKPNIERSGGLSGGASLMEIKKPYLVLTRPKQALAKNQNKYMGLPTWITRTLSSVKGYTKVEHIKLGNTHATEEEQKEIISLLKEGVFL